MKRLGRQAKPKTAAPSPLDPFIGQRLLGACPDCGSHSYLHYIDGTLHMTVQHDETCPWLAAYEATP